jgi:hypothetical protein
LQQLRDEGRQQAWLSEALLAAVNPENGEKSAVCTVNSPRCHRSMAGYPGSGTHVPGIPG